MSLLIFCTREGQVDDSCLHVSSRSEIGGITAKMKYDSIHPVN